jgi:predicted nucleic acid-binding protein
MRETERGPTVAFMDACETLPVDRLVADQAAERVREGRARGVTVQLPDALIAATAFVRGIPLNTCNARRYEGGGIEVRGVGGEGRASRGPETR